MSDQNGNYDILSYLEDYVRDYPDKEIRVLNAAINAFSEKGFSATTTKEISQRAGMAEGTIFRYFKTKDAILERMVPLLIRVMQPRLEKPIREIIADHAGESVDVIFTSILIDRLRIIRGNERFIKSVLPELLYRQDLGRQLTETLLPMIRHYIELVLEAAKQRGEVRQSVNADTAVHQLMGFVLMYSMFGSVDEAQMETDVKAFMDNVAKGWTTYADN